MKPPSRLRNSIAENIRTQREAKGLSQRDLAAAAGISQKHLSEIENGRVNLSIEVIEKIAAALRIDPKLLTR